MAIRPPRQPAPRVIPHGNQLPSVAIPTGKGKAPLYPAHRQTVGPVVSPAAAQLAQVRDYYAKNGHVPTELANLSRQYFGTANAKDVSNLGMQVALGKMSLAQAQSTVRQGSSGLDPIAMRAGLAADTQITPQEHALETQANLGQDSFNRSDRIGSANNARTVDEQQQIYGRLHQQLASQLPVQNAIYDHGAQGVDSAYAGLQKALGANYGGAIQGTTDEAARLGLQAATPDATRQLTSDQNFLQGVAGIQHSGEQGTLTNQRNSALTDALSAMQQSATEGTALSGNTLRDYAKSSSDARFQQAQQTAGLRQQSAALEGTRKGQIYENTANLNQNAAQAAYQQQQDSFQNKLLQQKADAQSSIAGARVSASNTDSKYKMGQLGVAQTNAQTNANYKSGQLQIAKLDAMTKRQAANATAGLDAVKQREILDKMTPGTLAYKQIESQIAHNTVTGAAAAISSAAAKQNADTNQYRATHPNTASKASTRQNGIASAAQYAAQNSFDPQVSSVGQDIINGLQNKYDFKTDSPVDIHVALTDELNRRRIGGDQANQIRQMLAAAGG